MNKVIFTRKELYDLAWSIPRTNIIEKYAISNDGFKKLCEKMVIPIPKADHWQKIKYNKKVNIEMLPQCPEMDDSIELIIREAGCTVNYDQSPLTMLTKEILDDKNAPLKVPDKIIHYDELIKNTMEFWEHRKKRDWRIEFKKEYLRINVEENNKTRACRFIDTLIKLIRYRGHSFKKTQSGPVAVINNVEFELFLRESTKRIPQENWHSPSCIHTGKLVLKVYRYYESMEWRDRKVLLEEQLAKIMAKMELEAERIHKIQEENRIYNILKQEHERIKNEFDKLKDVELIKLKELIKNAKRFEKAQKIRRYIRQVIARKSIDIDIENWVKWANEKADWLDPLINREDILFENIDKDTLSPLKKFWY